MSDKNFIRIGEVQGKVKMKTSAIYKRITPGNKQYDPTFPRAVKFSSRFVAWLESEVDAWVEAQVAKRDQSGSVASS